MAGVRLPTHNTLKTTKMTKEQFLNKYFSNTALIMPDLEAVIATEIAKVQDAKPQPEELKGNCSTFDMSRLVDQEYKPTDQVTDQVTDQEQPEKTEKEKIDHILTNKLTWKPIGNKRFYANMFSGKASDGSRQVCFVDYNNPHSGYFETRIFKIDLAEWQPVETKQPAKPFDKDRFEAMFRAVVASGEYKGKEFDKTAESLTQLDAYYASKEGGNNE